MKNMGHQRYLRNENLNILGISNTVNSPMMFRLLVISLIINGAITIREGVYEGVNQLNFAVSIWYFHEHRCSGAIIDDTHVLTTGHCVYGVSKCILSVAAGIVEWNNRTLQVIRVKELHIHPDFKEIYNPLNPNDLRSENDIAIIELAENVIWSSIVGPVRLLHREFEWETCSVCKLLGWSDEIIDDGRLLSLRWVPAIMMTNEECGYFNIHLFNNEKCVDNVFPYSVMENGDRGSLFICGDSAVGLFVDGGEIEKKPSILLDINPYLEFIAETLQTGPINAPLSDFQYFVSLWYFGIYICGGTIIDASHIVTAAHCMDDLVRTGIRIVAGHNEFYETDQTVEWLRVENIQIHPNYEEIHYNTDLISTKNDIAIITLNVSLMWTANIRPVKFGDALPDEQPLEVYRWIPQYTPERCMKSVHSYGSLMTLQSCRILRILFEPHQYCIRSLHSLPIAATGDSGSPIIFNGRLVGILHGGMNDWNELLGSMSPVIFTSIFPYIDWIKSAVTDNSF